MIKIKSNKKEENGCMVCSSRDKTFYDNVKTIQFITPNFGTNINLCQTHRKELLEELKKND